MKRLRFLIMLSLLTFCSSMLNAQDNELKLGLRAGHNAAFGGFTAVSLETTQKCGPDFSVNAGLQYNTIGKTTLELHPEYHILFDWGKFAVQAVGAYTHLGSTNSLAVGAGLHVDSRVISGKLGYYYRLFGGRGGKITEPFNVYYEFCAHLLPNLEKWDLDLVITNCELFELERHFQPSFIAEGSYFPKSNLGISFGLGCKPAGMFNMYADYYQTYIKTGVCYRW